MSPPKILFLQNHGVFVAADSVEEIEALYAHIFETLKAKVQPLPEEGLRGGPARGYEAAIAAVAEKAVETAATKFNVRFFFTSNSLIGHFLASPEAFVPLSSPFTPDHIVYAGAWPLFVNISEAQSSEHLISKIDEYRIRYQEMPKIIAIQNLGFSGLGRTRAQPNAPVSFLAMQQKSPGMRAHLGSVHPMQPADIEFIRSWEVEKYRASIAASSNPAS
jgi:hypothetical protein